MFRANLAWFVGCLLTISGAVRPFTAVGADNARERDLCEYYLRGMKTERARLRTGHFTFHGTKFVRGLSKDAHPELRGNVSGMYAFDRDQKAFRYDNEEPAYVRSVDSASAQDTEALKAAITVADVRKESILLHYLRNGEYSASWTRTSSRSSNSVYLRTPNASMGGLVAEIHHIFDVSACGAMTYMDFVKQTSLEAIIANLLSMDVRSVVLEGATAVLELESAGASATLTLDESRGFGPVSYTLRWRTDPSVMRSTGEWSQIEGIWVPTAFSVELDNPQEDGGIERYEFQHEWESVNQKIDPLVFDFRTFDKVPDGELIIDLRGEQPKDVGTLTRGGTVVPIMFTRSANPLPKDGGRLSVTVLWVGAATLVIGFVLWFLTRRRAAVGLAR